MTRLIVLSLAVAFCGCRTPSSNPASIDEFTNAIPVEFIGTRDPGYIQLRYQDGRDIEATYDGIDYSVLAKWEGEAAGTGEKRQMTLSYSLLNGVEVRDNLTRTKFRLSGQVENHPIDHAIRLLEEQHGTSTTGMITTARLATEAWNAELNRVYESLGGDQNPRLRDAHRAWIAYRDAQTKFLLAHYGEKEGTIWPLVCAAHIMEMTRNQAMLLQQVREW